MTNVPLSSEPASAFTWSFDRVVAGAVYAEETVQPVLHRYNDAKYIWSDASARAWLQGFVQAHDPTVRAAARTDDGNSDSTHCVVIDLEAEDTKILLPLLCTTP